MGSVMVNHCRSFGIGDIVGPVKMPILVSGYDSVKITDGDISAVSGRDLVAKRADKYFGMAGNFVITQQLGKHLCRLLARNGALHVNFLLGQVALL